MNQNGKDKAEVLVICGPTASGKSGLAIEVAKTIKGEIVSADSMQIYQDMNIGTAKISPEENLIVKHHMIDVVKPTEKYSVAEYSKDATEVIHQLLEEGKTPIVCGGTGQYINALLDGLIFIDIPTDEAIRSDLMNKINEDNKIEWHQKLSKLDPASADIISPNNLKRLRRFFEVYLTTQMTQTEIKEKSRQKGPDFKFKAYYLKPNRQSLYARINQRVIEMFEQGLVDEIKYLINKYPGIENSQSFQAIGYKETLAYIREEQSLKDTIDHIATSTRRYAKRQFTWFNARDDLIILENPDINQINIS